MSPDDERTSTGSGLIGVISDTHGHLAAAAEAALDGVALIIHAGDLDTPQVLERLRRIAPVVAVRGNMDRGPWAEALPPAELVAVAGVHVYVLHMAHLLDLDPAAAGVDVVVCGHTHRPGEERRGGVLYLNPGSASLPRGGNPPSLALLRIGGGTVRADFVPLAGDPAD